MILVWDPGLRHLGVTVGSRQFGVLFAFLLDNPIGHQARGPAAWKALANTLFERLRGIPIEELVYEKPQIYKGKAYKADVDEEDLKELDGINAAICDIFKARGRKVFSYLPHEWKKNLPKEVMVRRFTQGPSPIITPIERALITLPKSCHICGKNTALDVYDSVGIFYHHIGRKFLTGR